MTNHQSFQCDNVQQRFGSQMVLQGVDWSLGPAVVAGLVGASGAGKTTLLRILAGLDACSGGRVSFPAWASHARGWLPVGMVFQNLGLWPHLTARQHVQCVLGSKRGRAGRGQVEELLQEVRLPSAAWDRRPAELSGGEGQRLALARALATRPHLLLLDEPLAQVDMSLRAELLELIEQLADSRHMTVIYVTHCWPEVLALCHQVAVLIDGRIGQQGPLDEVFRRPANAEVARLTGPVVELPGGWLQEGHIRVVPDPQWPAVPARPGQPAAVRPQQIRLVEPDGGFAWRVQRCRPHSAGWLLTLAAEPGQFQVVSPGPATRDARLSVQLLAAPPAVLQLAAGNGITTAPPDEEKTGDTKR